MSSDLSFEEGKLAPEPMILIFLTRPDMSLNEYGMAYLRWYYGRKGPTFVVLR